MATVTYEDILQAQRRIQPFISKLDLLKLNSPNIHAKSAFARTPMITSTYFNQRTGYKVFMKAENVQKTGSFKARGALNAVMLLKERGEGGGGVVTHSSGNHGQALAWAAATVGIPSTVVVPNNAPKELRIGTCEKVSKEQGATIVHPHDDLDVIAGQGTLGLELASELQLAGKAGAVLVPTGGGGMVSGIATALAAVAPDTRVFCVGSAGKEGVEASLRAGRPLEEGPPRMLDTIADGIRPDRLGHHCFPLVLKHCQKDFLTVENEEIVSMMKTSWERLKGLVEMVLETSTAVGLSGLCQERLRSLLGPGEHTVAVILCGGNVDLDSLPWIGK